MNLLKPFIFLLISLLSATAFAVPPTPAKYQAYGSFNLPARDAESAQAYLTRLVQEAREPTDPPIAIHFINSSSQIAEIAPAGYGRGYEIYISNGFIKHMGSEICFLASSPTKCGTPAQLLGFLIFYKKCKVNGRN